MNIMKNLSIIFQPVTSNIDPLEYQLILNRIPVTKGNDKRYQHFTFEVEDVWCVETESHYQFRSVFELNKGAEYEFRGFNITFDPSQCMFGHTILPSNDMDTSRCFGFDLLHQELSAHLGDDPFVKLFNQYQATVDRTCAAFYMPFPNHNAARTALQAVISNLEAIYVNPNRVAYSYSQPECKGTLSDTIWTLSSDSMSFRLFVANEPCSDQYWNKTNQVTAHLPDEFLEYARSVLVIEVSTYDKFMEVHGNSSPLIWDLPSVSMYELIRREVTKVLRLDDVEQKITCHPAFPKEIMSNTFNRQTGMTYLGRQPSH